MKRKLQVFISSTFQDLQDERQAAVRAVLDMGHIPAGMELFKAGRETLETIYQWIDESDIYILILGGRYGSIEPESGKSYTHLEYDYALSKEKPAFALVINSEELERRVRENGNAVQELDNRQKYFEFKEFVESKLRYEFKHEHQIEHRISTMIAHFEKTRDFSGCGWISAKEVKKLEEENAEFRSNIKLLTSIVRGNTLNGSPEVAVTSSNESDSVTAVRDTEPLLRKLETIRYLALERLDSQVLVPSLINPVVKGNSISCILAPELGEDFWDAVNISVQYTETVHGHSCDVYFKLHRGQLIEEGTTKNGLNYLLGNMNDFAFEKGIEIREQGVYTFLVERFIDTELSVIAQFIAELQNHFNYAIEYELPNF